MTVQAAFTFAANLTTMFTEWDFLDRFDAAADAGFEAVEYLFAYEYEPEVLADRLARNGLRQAMFNFPPGDWSAGERGLAALAGRGNDLDAATARGIAYAQATGARQLHLMAGIADCRDADVRRRYLEAVTAAAERCAEKGLGVLLEPINPRSMPGYFLNDFDLAERLILEAGQDNVKLQYDLFHRQIIHGDITASFERLLPLIGHVQIAGVPARHEPDTGELNFPALCDLFATAGYAGFVGCEYFPAATTIGGLGWFRSYKAT